MVDLNEIGLVVYIPKFGLFEDWFHEACVPKQLFVYYQKGEGDKFFVFA